MNVLINFILFQIGWFSAVLSAANNIPWFGVLIICLIVIFHLYHAIKPFTELILLALVGLAGFFLDSIFVAFGWLSYPSGYFIENLTTYWILAMWVLFATTLNISLSWLKPHLVISAVCGFIGGPLTYYAGNKLGAIYFIHFEYTMFGLAIGWAISIPLLLRLAEKFNGINFSISINDREFDQKL